MILPLLYTAKNINVRRQVIVIKKNKGKSPLFPRCVHLILKILFQNLFISLLKWVKSVFKKPDLKGFAEEEKIAFHYNNECLYVDKNSYLFHRYT